MELRNRRRRTGETLQDLHDDIRRLAALAYPHVPSQMREEIACDHFLDALGDANLVLKVPERRPADLDSALRLASRFEKAPLPDYGVSRCLASGRTDLAVEALRREVKDTNKWMEFEHRTSGSPVGGCRPPVTARHTTPSAYSGVPSAPLSSRGSRPVRYGNRSNLTRPTHEDGMGRNGSFCQTQHSNSRCFICGSPAHRARACLVPSVERSRPEWQPTSPLVRRLPHIRPLRSRYNKRDLTCIKAKYRQYELSALIDTGSDVSIAGEDIARDLGWTIHKHCTTEVSIANNKMMSVLGATRCRPGCRRMRHRVGDSNRSRSPWTNLRC